MVALSTKIRKIATYVLGVTVPAFLVLGIWLWDWRWIITGVIVGLTAIVLDPEKKYAGR